MTSPNECLQLFTALKLHFSSPKYDYFKYKGHLKNPPKFEKRHDKHFFSWLSRKPDPKGLMVANLIKNPNIFVGDLFGEEAQTTYSEWKKRTESLSYIFSEDLEKLDILTCFKVIDGQHPDLLKKYLQNEISIETVAILDNMLAGAMVMKWDRELKDDPIWQSIRLLIIRYQPFLTYDKVKFSKIVLDKQYDKVYDK